MAAAALPALGMAQEQEERTRQKGNPNAELCVSAVNSS